MSKRWYAVQAFSGYEKIVQKGLLDRVAQSGHEDLFGDILVPVEEVVEMKSGKKTIT
jgi:transcriptional antiterminator NusG